MNIKKFLTILLLSVMGVPTLHAAETPALETQDVNQAVLVAEVKPMPVAEASVTMANGKSRVQVVSELVEAIQDGSYVPPSELYPASSVGAAQR